MNPHVIDKTTSTALEGQVNQKEGESRLIEDHLVRHSNRSMDNGDGDLKKPPPAAPVTIDEATTPSEGLSTISE